MLNKIERFNLKKFKLRKNGMGNIGDFKSSAAYLKKLGMKIYRKVEVATLTETGDRRGYYYDIADTLEGMKRYKYGGWANISIYGRPAFIFYVK